MSIKRNKEPLSRWPEDWRDELFQTVRTAYAEIGADLFKGRFEYFSRVMEQAIAHGPLMERHPVDFGFFLLMECPDSVNHIGPGYFSWAYAFSRLLIKLSGHRSQGLQRDIRANIKRGLALPTHGTEETTLTPVFSHLRVFDYLERCQKGFTVHPGEDLGIKADLGFRYGTDTIGMDVKCFLRGWFNTSWDGLLESALDRSSTLNRFWPEDKAMFF